MQFLEKSQFFLGTLLPHLTLEFSNFSKKLRLLQFFAIVEEIAVFAGHPPSSFGEWFRWLVVGGVFFALTLGGVQRLIPLRGQTTPPPPPPKCFIKPNFGYFQHYSSKLVVLAHIDVHFNLS